MSHALDQVFANTPEILDPLLRRAVRVAFKTYGDIISPDDKDKDLLKFGRNDTVASAATGSTLMTLAGTEDHETYVDDNLIDTISADNADDDGKTITIEYHTVDEDGDFTFGTQNAVIDQLNKVSIVAGARISRMFNADGTDLVGNVYAYQDGDITDGVPDTADEVHCIIKAGKNSSQKAATTISKDDYFILTGWTAGILEKSAIYADVELQVRLKGGVFRAIDTITLIAGQEVIKEKKPYIIVPKNSDIRLVAVSSTDNKAIGGTFYGMLASVRSGS